MALEDIERLKEKLEKDPGSKLFVPLAEEYKKAGMIDEAIDILTRGLEMQPRYLSARVSLGKIFIEKGMLGEAKAEFEEVIASIPDNLYAHKKLAEIYRDLGERDNAIKEFRTVLKLNPMDESAVSVLSALEEEQKIPAQEPSVIEAQEISGLEEEGEEEVPFKITLEERDETPSYVFPEAGEETGKKEEPSSEISTSEESSEPRTLPSEEVGESVIEEISEEKEIRSGDSISEEDMELWKTHLEAVDEMEEAEETLELPAEAIAEAEETGESVSGTAGLHEESLSCEDILKEPDAAEQEEEVFTEAEAVSEQPETGRTVADADRCIQHSRYREAMNIYKTILAADPGNRNVMQRIEELKMLLKLFGKDKENLIMKLEGFMQGIKKRRDEFPGSP